MQTRFVREAFRSFLLLIALCAVPALADEEKSLEDLLVEKGVITAEERRELEPGAAGADLPDAASNADESGKETAEEKPKVIAKADYKGIRFETTDGKFEFAFGGRIQIDAAGYIEGISPLGAGIEIRRGRIKSYGTLWDDWDYKLEVNFDADLGVPMTDALIAYDGFEPVVIVIGHQKVPFSQQSMTSSNWQVFQERGLPDAFIDNTESGRRRLGGVVGAHGKNGIHWNVSTGVFGSGLDDAGTLNEDWGVAGRAVLAPFAEKTRVLAFGGAAYYRKFNGLTDVDYGAPPESNIAGTDMVDTGLIPNADNHLMWNVDGSAVWGPLHAQGEYTQAIVNRYLAALPTNPPSLALGTSTVKFSGWYVQAGYFITGESRNYDIKSGKYKRIMPHSSRWGAWEVAARYSMMDLQDRDILGGRQADVTVALNWWANANFMFRLNYVYADVTPNSAETLQGVPETAHVFQGRAQVVF